MLPRAHRALTACIAALAGLASPFTLANPSYLERSDVRTFIDAQVKAGIDRGRLETLMRSATRQQSILDAIARPVERTMTWGQYRKIFITEDRISKGVTFYNAHREVLLRARKEYGVEPEIIVAIIGVETRYGENKGQHRVIDALATLGFDYPPRAEFFRRQLGELMHLEREAGLDVSSIKGSYAGALGFPQFIPSSYRAFAVDFDGDKKIDLIDNPVDAIGSVANYFREHRWTLGAPVVFRAELTGQPSALKGYVNAPLGTWSTAKVAASKGLSVTPKLQDSERVIPMQMDTDEGPEYWVGLHNFYVITRYNHSPLYAMAVHQLSREIKERL